MKLELPLEYCSLQYAEYWFGKERPIVQGLRSPDLSTRLEHLADGIGYFRVARPLPTKFDVERGRSRFEPILEILAGVGARPAGRDEMVATVIEFANAISHVYGRSQLSAASKVLWLRHQDPFIVFDSQARWALGARDGDYRGYVDKWERSYDDIHPAIGEACDGLSRMRLYLSMGLDLSDAEIRDTAQQEWFRRRVHDIYLWEGGSDA